MLAKWFRKIAGADESILACLPEDEKTWMTQLGVVLMLTFIFLWTIIYFSIEYLANGLEGKELFWTRVFLAGIAVVMTSLIVALDRAFILSDWYAQKDISSATIAEKFTYIMLRGWKIMPRMMISGFMAFVISIFLLLRFYDGKIETMVKADHVKSNLPYEKKLESFQHDYESKNVHLQQQITDLENELSQPSPLFSTGFGNASVDVLKQSVDNTDKALNDVKQELEALRKSKDYITQQGTLYQLGCIREKMELERSSELKRTVKVCGESYTTSGIAKEGKRFRTLNARKSALEEKLAVLKGGRDVLDEEQKLKVQIEKLQKRYDEVQDQYSKAYKEDVAKREARSKQGEQFKELHLSKLKDELRDRQEKKDSVLESYEQKLKASLYVPYEDGPMVRYVMLQKLFADEQYGEAREKFALLFKILLVLFELIPILMKVVFGKKSAYAILLQRRYEEILNDENVCRSDDGGGKL